MNYWPRVPLLIVLVGIVSVGCSEPRKGSPDGGGSGGGGSSGGGSGGSAGGAGTGADDGGAGAGGEAGSAVDASTDGPPPGLQPILIRGGDPNGLFLHMRMAGEGLTEFEGRLVTVRTGFWPDGRWSSGQARIIDGRFSLEFPQGHEASLYTQKTVLFDVDGDGRCSPGDAVWNDFSATPTTPELMERDFGPGATGGIAATGGFTGPAGGGRPLDAPTADDCRRIEMCAPYAARAFEKRAFIDQIVRGEGFDAFEGRYVRLAARTAGGATKLGSARAKVFGGRFTMLLPAGIPRQVAPELLWFVDADGDNKCSATSGDLLGYTTPDAFDPPANEPATVSIGPAAATVPGNVDVCAAFEAPPTMTVTGAGFAVDERHPFFVITRMPSGARLGAFGTHVSGGALPAGLTFERRPGQEVVWYDDASGIGECVAANAHTGVASTAGADPAGNLTLPITDTRAATTPGGDDVCAVINGCL